MKSYRLRCWTIFSFITAGICLFLFRFAYLSVLPTDFRNKLIARVNRQAESEVTLAPPRAQIVDRNGHTLAVTVLRPSIFLLPRQIPKNYETLKAISEKLDIPIENIRDWINSKKSFVWAKRQLSPEQLEALGDISQWQQFMRITEEPKRIYPEKELAAHLIGFVSIDNQGLEGIEHVYNKSLTGEAMQAKVTRDARGKLTLTTLNGAVKPEPSTAPLRLSIDVSIQTFTENALQSGVIKAKAKGGSAIVMDIHSGEILAIASYPTFNLNLPQNATPQQRRFRPVMDALEIGSVVKPIFIAKAIDMGVVKPEEKIFCENGQLKIPGGMIRDTHPNAWLSPAEIIKVSSNICTYKIAQKMGRKAFAEALVRSGLVRQPGSGLPGEWRGHILPWEEWREMRFANMAFGQGIAISPLQMTKAMATLTGGGTEKGVRMLALDHKETPDYDYPPLEFVSTKTSDMITKMMRSVIEEEGGTGKLASIPDVTVAGKTGTAQKFDISTGTYSERISSFIGVFPAEKPRFVVTIVIDEPQVRPAYGGLLAGPVFSEIGQKTIRYLNAMGMLAFGADKN